MDPLDDDDHLVQLNSSLDNIVVQVHTHAEHLEAHHFDMCYQHCTRTYCKISQNQAQNVCNYMYIKRSHLPLHQEDTQIGASAKLRCLLFWPAVFAHRLLHKKSYIRRYS